jgi:hypothetical protein
VVRESAGIVRSHYDGPVASLTEILVPALSGVAGVVASICTQVALERKKMRHEINLADRQERRTAYEDFQVALGGKRSTILRMHEAGVRLEMQQHAIDSLDEEVRHIYGSVVKGLWNLLESVSSTSSLVDVERFKNLLGELRRTLTDSGSGNVIERIAASGGQTLLVDSFGAYLVHLVASLKKGEVLPDVESSLTEMVGEVTTATSALQRAAARMRELNTDLAETGGTFEALAEETKGWQPEMERWRYKIREMASEEVLQAANDLLAAFGDPDKERYEQARTRFRDEVGHESRRLA